MDLNQHSHLYFRFRSWNPQNNFGTSPTNSCIPHWYTFEHTECLNFLGKVIHKWIPVHVHTRIILSNLYPVHQSLRNNLLASFDLDHPQCLILGVDLFDQQQLVLTGVRENDQQIAIVEIFKKPLEHFGVVVEVGQVDDFGDPPGEHIGPVAQRAVSESVEFVAGLLYQLLA